MTRPPTRSLLASAIEYAAQDKLTTIEWHRFFVNHYHDELMEDARRETVRILLAHPKRDSMPVDVRERLDELAASLRRNRSSN